jgi:hypothetical protein
MPKNLKLSYGYTDIYLIAVLGALGERGRERLEGALKLYDEFKRKKYQ